MMWILLCWAAVAFLFHLIGNQTDRQRIEKDITSRRGKLLDLKRHHQLTEWIMDERDRMYQIRYLDQWGNEHQARGETSRFAGVSWFEDVVIKYADADEDVPEQDQEAKLRSDNAALKAELASLKQTHYDEVQALEFENRRLQARLAMLRGQ